MVARHCRDASACGAVGVRRASRRRTPRPVEEFIAPLYAEHARDLLGWFQSRTFSAEVAADLCAETFAAAIESFDRYEPGRGAPGAWLWGIARNMLRRYQRDGEVERRATRRFGVRVPLVVDDQLDLVDDRCDAAAMAGLLAEALDELSDGVAEAVRARVVDGLDYEAVAARCGCSEAAARVRVSRGLSGLLDDLRPTSVQETSP